MSEAAAVERSPDSTSIRRWPRYKVNVPIRVIVSRAMKASIFDGPRNIPERRWNGTLRQLAETEHGPTPHALGELYHR